MSKKSKVRKIAEALPDMPKLKNGRVRYDGYGSIILTNHFRELSDIMDCGLPEERIKELCHIYCQMVWGWEIRRKSYINHQIKQHIIITAAEMVLTAILAACLIKLTGIITF